MAVADDPQPVRPYLVDDAVDRIGDVESVLDLLGIGQFDVGAVANPLATVVVTSR